MNLPETCPFCGSGGELRNGEKWIGFTCITTIHAGHDARRLQSMTCAGLERTRLFARVASLEAENKSLRDAGDALARHVEGYDLGKVARRLVEAWKEVSR